MFSVLNYWKLAGLAEPNGSLKLTCLDRNQAPYVFEAKPFEGLDEYMAGAAPVALKPKACPTSQPNHPFFSIAKLDGGKTLYAQYNCCAGREIDVQLGKSKEEVAEQPSIHGFFDELLGDLRSSDVERLIFDLRWNSGGHSAPGKNFVMKLAQLETINQPGKIFVLIGRRTFSSGVLNAIDFKRNTHAILIGEPTSGNLASYGDIKSFDLPHTRITVYYSTKYFRLDGDNQGSLMPDITAARTFSDYMNSIDPAFETALNHRLAAPAPVKQINLRL